MQQTRKKVKRNFKIFSIYMAILGFMPYTLIAILYYEQILGSYALAMSIFSIIYFTVFLVEIPLGIMSDFIGRKKTMILGGFTMLISFILYIIPSLYSSYPYLIMSFGAFFQGISMALFSGTDEAIVYESAEFLDVKKYEYKKYFGRGKAFNQFLSSIGMVLSGIISYFYSYVYCFYISLFLAIIFLIINFFWVEVKAKDDKKEKGNSIYSHVGVAIKYFKENRELRIISLASVINSATIESYHRFEMLYYKIFLPDYLLGFARMFKKLMGTLGFLYATKIINKLKTFRALIISIFGMFGICLISILMNNFFTPFFAGFQNLFIGISQTGESELLQNKFSNEQRATMKSLVSMFASILFSVLGILMGYIADISSPRIALALILSVKFVPLLIYSNLYKKLI